MRNESQLARLKKGGKAWNAWRAKNRQVKIDLSGADLNEANLNKANLNEANLNEANLNKANLNEALLNEALLNKALLNKANLNEADLRMAYLGGADLSGADLGGAYLNEATLNGATLSGATLRGANLRGADLSEATLSRADLRGATLSRADLRWANLSGADLSGADLSEATLRGADLSEATLSGARLGETILSNTNLTQTRGLDSCAHIGPSTIDHRTLMLSKPLSIPFLRGCGLPDTLINYLPSLFNEPLQFYSCFISYSTTDQPFAERIHADLQNKGVRCWFAPHDIQGGQKIHEQIDQAIRVYEKLLLVLSEASLNSGWVEFEIRKARKREVSEQCRILFPIRLIDYDILKRWERFDADTQKDLGAEIREYFIPDFSTWKSDHDTYQQTFDKLLRDLRAKAQEEQKKST